jgi:hypothetical protein
MIGLPRENPASTLLGRMRPMPFNRMEEECFSELVSQLQTHVDYRGSVANDVNSLIAFLIQFLVYCLNVSFEVANPPAYIKAVTARIFASASGGPMKGRLYLLTGTRCAGLS